MDFSTINQLWQFIPQAEFLIDGSGLVLVLGVAGLLWLRRHATHL
jgi:hypothetical protein